MPAITRHYSNTWRIGWDWIEWPGSPGTRLVPSREEVLGISNPRNWKQNCPFKSIRRSSADSACKRTPILKVKIVNYWKFSATTTRPADKEDIQARGESKSTPLIAINSDWPSSTTNWFSIFSTRRCRRLRRLPPSAMIEDNAKSTHSVSAAGSVIQGMWPLVASWLTVAA